MKKIKRFKLNEAYEINDIDINPTADELIFKTPRITPEVMSQLESIKHKYAYVLDLKEANRTKNKMTLKEWAKALSDEMDVKNIPELGLAHQTLLKHGDIKIYKAISIRNYWDNNLNISGY